MDHAIADSHTNVTISHSSIIRNIPTFESSPRWT
ncbi:hypothetical protein GA0115240_165710 [Streptomyces sp. DvalAA-14]|nr:hypothetical protein GA0115240_165710 [Streptomyces sp. DvalAA-14]